MSDRNSSPDQRLLTVAVAVFALIAVALVAVAVAPVFSQQTGGDQPPSLERPETNQSAGEVDATGPDIGPVLVVVLAAGALVVGIQFVRDPWNSLKLVFGLAVVGVVSYLVWTELSNVDQPRPESNESLSIPEITATPEPNGSTGFEPGSATSFSWPAGDLALAAAVAAVAGVVVFLAWRTGAVDSLLDSGGDDRSDDLNAVGRVAGDAADRIESASTPEAADNAIYRAWSEMVALLGAPDPQSGTPRQFETAAIESGMDPDDVRVLTRTFEQVRYGDAALSAERRERATAAFRRIQATHDDGPASEGDRDETDANDRRFDA